MLLLHKQGRWTCTGEPSEGAHATCIEIAGKFVMLVRSGSSNMLCHYPASCCNDAQDSAMAKLAAALKHVIFPHPRKPQHSSPPNRSNKQGGVMQQWLCGCTNAGFKSSITSAAADDFVTAPLAVNSYKSCTAGSRCSTSSRAASTANVVSPPSTAAVSTSETPAAVGWRCLYSSACSPVNSRQLASNGRFSSYHSSEAFEEQAAAAAWHDFMSWRQKWLEIASQHRFSFREADLPRHEAELLQRVQQGSAITLCSSDSMRSSNTSTSAAQASVPPVLAAQSTRDWGVFLELPEFVCSEAEAAMAGLQMSTDAGTVHPSTSCLC